MNYCGEPELPDLDGGTRFKLTCDSGSVDSAVRKSRMSRLCEPLEAPDGGRRLTVLLFVGG